RRLTHRASVGEGFDLRLRATRVADKYAGVPQAIANLAVADALGVVERLGDDGVLIGRSRKDALSPYRNAIAGLVPHLRLARLEMRGTGPVVLFDHKNGRRLALDELSDGEQQAVLFAVTFTHLRLDNAIVLIDVPELFIDG